MAVRREIIRTGPAPRSPISPAVRADGRVYTSGMLGIDPKSGNLVEGGIKAQTRQALENLKAALESGGSGLDRVVKATVFITDKRLFADMNEVYRQYFPADPPARSTVECGLMLEGAVVEIELVAISS